MFGRLVALEYPGFPDFLAGSPGPPGR